MMKISDAVLRLKKELLKSEISTEKNALLKASIDNSRYSFLPDAVVFIKDASEISIVLKIANELEIPISIRGAGSGGAGAALAINGGIVLDLSALNSIKIDPISWIAEVEAGAINENIDNAAKEFGLMYPPDPASKKYSTIGGNIACNAGGLRAAKYGVTRDYVLALEGYLPKGEFVKFSRPLKKSAVAMNLRDLWVGSEGTLGVITKAYLKLIARPKFKQTMLAFFVSDKMAFRAVKEILKSGTMPSVLEFMDADSVRVASEFKKKSGITGALLLIECDGNEDEVRLACTKIAEVLKSYSTKLELAKDETESESLWEMRRACSPAMFLLNSAKLAQDIVIPLLKTEEFFEYYKQVGKDAKLPTPTFGHAADGNYHIHLMYDIGSEEEKNIAYNAMDKIILKAIELGGSISGEHGIGIVKSRLLDAQISSEEKAAMLAVKKSLDPKNILSQSVVYGNIDIRKYTQNKDIILPWDKH